MRAWASCLSLRVRVRVSSLVTHRGVHQGSASWYHRYSSLWLRPHCDPPGREAALCAGHPGLRTWALLFPSTLSRSPTPENPLPTSSAPAALAKALGEPSPDPDKARADPMASTCPTVSHICHLYLVDLIWNGTNFKVSPDVVRAIFPGIVESAELTGQPCLRLHLPRAPAWCPQGCGRCLSQLLCPPVSLELKCGQWQALL